MTKHVWINVGVPQTTVDVIDRILASEKITTTLMKAGNRIGPQVGIVMRYAVIFVLTHYRRQFIDFLLQLPSQGEDDD